MSVPEPEHQRAAVARQAEVVVYGATAAGVVAAVAAAREGVSVTLLEPGEHVGGMVSGGLGWTDVGQREVIGGLALEFYARVGRAYGGPAFAYVGPEPHVAERILREWLEQAGVEVVFGCRVHEVEKTGTRLERLQGSSGEAFEAAVFVDASYEGDLLARAGVAYRVGREDRDLHGESWAGRQPLRPGQHQFDAYVSPFADSGELLPLIHDRPPAPMGRGDGAVQGYGFRLCLTRDPSNRLPFPQPEAYDPARFELLRRFLALKGEAVQARDLLVLHPNLPNDKADVNAKGPLSTNLLDGSNWAYPEAPYEARAAIWRRHLGYVQELLYFLSYDAGVPAHIRQDMSAWGLCRDEFVDTGHWPHQLYVREARRMQGEHVMTQRDLCSARRKYDSVGMGSYHIDIRHTQRIWDEVHLHPRLVPAVFNEGYISVPVSPYEIPYRSLVPSYQECSNLLVPVCLSASHVAFASLRMEPQYMILGHSAGVAAAMSVRCDREVQRVSVPELQARLAEAGQVLSLS